MSRASDRSRVARPLLAGACAAALCAALDAGAQPPAAEPATADAAPTAVAAEQPKSRRERRREAEAAEQAAAAEAAATAQPTGAETIEAKMICKNIKVTGTKMARRVCGTPEQWASVSDATRDDAEETMRQVRERSSIVTSQPGTPGPGGFGSQ